MYGTVASYKIKPGMEHRLLAFEAEQRQAGMPGSVVEFTAHSLRARRG